MATLDFQLYSYRNQWPRGRSRKTRIYGAFDLTPNELAEMERWTEPALSWPAEDWNDEEKAIYENYRKAKRALLKATRQELEDLLKAAGFPEDVKVAFNLNAGCSCPCSPGFVANQALTIDGTEIVAIHVKA